MGIMQFIPSTWQGYEARIASAFGISAADPWNPQHAIMATGIYLQESGAARGGYYAGGGWATRGLSYAASVIGHAERYQASIDFLENR
jgi:membrane-bound lytic murein transglycosylase B